MQDYETLYLSAKNKYNNACYEINYCNNRIIALNNSHKQLINRINRLEAEIKKSVKALEQLKNLSSRESDLKEKLRGIEIKTQEAAANYSSMVDFSGVSGKNLNEVYGSDQRQTQQKIDVIMADLHAKGSSLSQKLEDLKNNLNSTKQEFETNRQLTRTVQNDLSDWNRIKNNASYDMTYYKRKMDEDIYGGLF